MFPELITELLQEGYKVNFSAPGHSMFPTIMANETIMVEPIDPAAVKPGDIILYRNNGRLIAHRLVRIDKDKKINCAITEPQTSEGLQSNLFIEGDSPLLERSAHRAQRSSSAALREAVSPIFEHSAPQIPLKAGCSSSEALHHSAQSSVLSPRHLFTFRGDASVTCDAPVAADQILGKVVAIERNGCSINPYSLKHKVGCLVLTWANRLKRFFN